MYAIRHRLLRQQPRDLKHDAAVPRTPAERRDLVLPAAEAVLLADGADDGEAVGAAVAALEDGDVVNDAADRLVGRVALVFCWVLLDVVFLCPVDDGGGRLGSGGRRGGRGEGLT